MVELEKKSQQPESASKSHSGRVSRARATLDAWYPRRQKQVDTFHVYMQRVFGQLGVHAYLQHLAACRDDEAEETAVSTL